jgi:DNA-binding NtrC family response regulator
VQHTDGDAIEQVLTEAPLGNLLHQVAVGGSDKPHIRLEFLARPDRGKGAFLQHPWRGNVRELQSTLLRAALWCHGELIAVNDVEQALFRLPQEEANVLAMDVSQGIDLQKVIAEVAGQYLRKALEITGHNKTRAASLLGIKSQQTLSNWMNKYGID